MRGFSIRILLENKRIDKEEIRNHNRRCIDNGLRASSITVNLYARFKIIGHEFYPEIGRVFILLLRNCTHTYAHKAETATLYTDFMKLQRTLAKRRVSRVVLEARQDRASSDSSFSFFFIFFFSLSFSSSTVATEPRGKSRSTQD